MAEENKSRVFGVFSIIIGFVSFIPLIGLCASVIAFILGLVSIVKERSKLGILGIILAILGVFSTVIIYGGLFYFGFVQRGGIYDSLREVMIREQQLPNTVNALESYKARYGEYPENIEDLLDNGGDPFLIIDQSQLITNISFLDESEDITSLVFYYQKNDDNTYYLFSRGIDGIPFTSDDIHPRIRENPGKIGYIYPEEN